MKEFEITSDWIDRYNDDELDESEKSFFQQRMLHNPLLRTEVFLDARLNRFLRDEDILELRKKVQSVTRKTSQRSGLMSYLLIAASVLCLIILGAILFLNEKKPESTPVIAHRQTTLPLKKEVGNHSSYNSLKDQKPGNEILPVIPLDISKSPLLAANYKPMAELELLVGSVTRSTQVRLIIPGAKMIIMAGMPVRFAWVSENTRQPVVLVLMNNYGKMVYETPSLHANNAIIQTTGLPRGLYYWKIMLKDELVQIGKLTLY